MPSKQKCCFKRWTNSLGIEGSFRAGEQAMVAQLLVRRQTDRNIRPFSMQRDLAQLADLIELAFRAELEQSASSIAAEMRQLARLGPLLWLFSTSLTLFPPLMGGYVWIEEGQLVGNVTLSIDSRQRGLWIVSNVAVHPDFRGRGIARRLMEVALQEARSRDARWVALEVRTDNMAAEHLYQELDFQVYDTVAELTLPVHRWPRGIQEPLLPLRRRRPDDWQGLGDLARSATPAAVQEMRPISPYRYQMGVGRRVGQWFDNLFYRRRSSDWVLEIDSHIVAFLQLTGHQRRAAHQLQMTVHPISRGDVETQLLAAGLHWLSRFPARKVACTVSNSHPEAQCAFREAGFDTVRRLNHMRLDMRRDKERMGHE